MKKLLTLILVVSFVFGTAAISFASDQDKERDCTCVQCEFPTDCTHEYCKNDCEKGECIFDCKNEDCINNCDSEYCKDYCKDCVKNLELSQLDIKVPKSLEVPKNLEVPEKPEKPESSEYKIQNKNTNTHTIKHQNISHLK